MAESYKTIPFGKKLLLILMLTNMASIAATIGGFWIYDYHKNGMIVNQKTYLFEQWVAPVAKQALKNSNPELLTNAVEQAHLGYQFELTKPSGEVFSHSTDQSLLSLTDQEKKGYFQHALTITENGQTLGTLYVIQDLTFTLESIHIELVLGVFIFFIITLVTYLVARVVTSKATSSIQSLTQVATKVAHEKDFNLRAQKTTNDEFGVLTDAFNLMLNEIQQLEDAHADQLQLADDSYHKMKFLLEHTEKTKRTLEEEAIQRLLFEEDLKRTRNHLNDIINSMPSMLVCVDEKGVITECNQSAAKMAEIDHDDLLSKSVNDTYAWLRPYMEIVDSSIEQRQVRSVEKIALKDGDQDYYYNLLIYPLTQTSSNGAVIRIDDISNQVRMENMMVQTEKMMSVGGLAAGMAHEINNPLGGILQSAQNLVRRIDPNLKKNQEEAEKLDLSLEVMHQYLEVRGINRFIDGIRDSGERAAQIVRNMLQFSRKSDNTVLTPTDLSALLDRSVSLAANDYDMKKSYDFRKITIVKDYDDDLCQVPCVASEIEQVILNLLRNAAQAMHEQTDNAEPTIKVKTHHDNEYAIIDVTDNGPGMAPEQASRIFEPFFTTKEVGVGTGLGLSVSFFIIESKHEGHMEVHSVEGVGTTFTITIPLKHEKEQLKTG